MTVFPPTPHLNIIDRAEGVRFELTIPCGMTVFKTVALNHSAIPPLQPQSFKCSKKFFRHRRIRPPADKTVAFLSTVVLTKMVNHSLARRSSQSEGGAIPPQKSSRGILWDLLHIVNYDIMSVISKIYEKVPIYSLY